MTKKIKNDGGYRLRPHPTEVREDIARFLDDEAASLKGQNVTLDAGGLAGVIDALARTIRAMPVHPMPKGDGKELTICFVGPGGSGKTVVAHALAAYFRIREFDVTLRDEPAVITIRDGSSVLGMHLAEALETGI